MDMKLSKSVMEYMLKKKESGEKNNYEALNI